MADHLGTVFVLPGGQHKTIRGAIINLDPGDLVDLWSTTGLRGFEKTLEETYMVVDRRPLSVFTDGDTEGNSCYVTYDVTPKPQARPPADG